MSINKSEDRKLPEHANLPRNMGTNYTTVRSLSGPSPRLSGPSSRPSRFLSDEKKSSKKTGEFCLSSLGFKESEPDWRRSPPEFHPPPFSFTNRTLPISKTWKNLNPDEKSQVNEAKVNFQGRIITFETFACNDEEIYEALSQRDIQKLLNGKPINFVKISQKTFEFL